MTVELTGTPVLQTQRLTLRAVQASDCDLFVDFLTSDRGAFVGGGTELPRGKAWRAFASLIGHWAIHGCGIFAIVERSSGKTIGGIGPWFPEGWPEHEMSWSIWAPEAEGKGYAAEAARAALDYAFDTLGWDTCVSYIDANNARSIALAERMGATVDPTAAQPDDHTDLLVYRHAGPSGTDAEGGMEAYA